MDNSYVKYQFMPAAEMTNPHDRRYTARHQWVAVEPPYRIGITRFAQQQLGDVTYVEVPGAGEWLDAGEPFGVIESRKAISDMFMPVAATVIALNELAIADYSIIDSDPYGDGWLLHVEPDDPRHIALLLTPEEYEDRTG